MIATDKKASNPLDNPEPNGLTPIPKYIAVEVERIYSNKDLPIEEKIEKVKKFLQNEFDSLDNPSLEV